MKKSTKRTVKILKGEKLLYAILLFLMTLNLFASYVLI